MRWGFDPFGSGASVVRLHILRGLSVRGTHCNTGPSVGVGERYVAFLMHPPGTMRSVASGTNGERGSATLKGPVDQVETVFECMPCAPAPWPLGPMGAAKPRGRRFVMHDKRGDWGKPVLISCLLPLLCTCAGVGILVSGHGHSAGGRAIPEHHGCLSYEYVGTWKHRTEVLKDLYLAECVVWYVMVELLLSGMLAAVHLTFLYRLSSSCRAIMCEINGITYDIAKWIIRALPKEDGRP